MSWRILFSPYNVNSKESGGGSTLNRGRDFGPNKSKHGDLSKHRSRIDLYIVLINERVTVHMMLFHCLCDI